MTLPAERSDHEDFDLREMVRIHGLTDRFLGQYVLDLARKMRTENPELIGGTGRWQGYESWISWDVIPEIARRLGVTTLGKNEGTDAMLIEAERPQLRRTLGVALLESNFFSGLDDPDSAPACQLASRCVTRGNPFVIALDRAAPPAENRHERFDFLAMRMRSHLAAQGGSRRSTWSPDMVGGALAASVMRSAAAAEVITLTPRARPAQDPIQILNGVLVGHGVIREDDTAGVLQEVMARRERREAGSRNAFAEDFPDGFIDLPF